MSNTRKSLWISILKTAINPGKNSLLQETSTINEIGAKYGISPVVISRWKSEFVERAAEIFKKAPPKQKKNCKKKMKE